MSSGTEIDLPSFRAGLRAAANEMPAYDSTIGSCQADAMAAAILELTPASDPGEAKEAMIASLGRGPDDAGRPTAKRAATVLARLAARFEAEAACEQAALDALDATDDEDDDAIRDMQASRSRAARLREEREAMLLAIRILSNVTDGPEE